mmetsp:Transcript_44090/g.94484  ORF Transcript_44090/g.94484 Transcript_44090/m.94484 type:complete len:161 (+) Transcript_44090:683-1165(+)
MVQGPSRLPPGRSLRDSSCFESPTGITVPLRRSVSDSGSITSCCNVRMAVVMPSCSEEEEEEEEANNHSHSHPLGTRAQWEVQASHRFLLHPSHVLVKVGHHSQIEVVVILLGKSPAFQTRGTTSRNHHNNTFNSRTTTIEVREAQPLKLARKEASAAPA